MRWLRQNNRNIARNFQSTERKNNSISIFIRIKILPIAFVLQETAWLGSLILMDSAASLIVRTVKEYTCSIKKNEYESYATFDKT